MLFSWQLISLLAIVSTNVGGTNLGNRRRGKHLVICSPNHNHVESPTMDQLFTNHLNKDYPRISPRDGRNTSSHFVKIAILQGRGMGLKPAKSQPPYKT